MNRHGVWCLWMAVLLAAAAGAAGVWRGMDAAGVWWLIVGTAIAAVWVLRGAMAWESRMTRRQLEESCDPEPLLASSRELRAQLHPQRRRERSGWLGHGLNEFVALYELGQLNEAETLLMLLEPWIGPSAPPIQQASFAMDKAALYLAKHQPDEALPWIRRSEQAAHRVALSRSARDTFRMVLENHRWMYRFLTEESSQELLHMALQRAADAGTLRVQVREQYSVSLCLLSLGRPEEARPHLEFVAEHGGKLAIRQEALQRLAELECPRA